MQKKTLYLDMDGVVADFNQGAHSVLGYHIKDTSAHYPDQEWQKIKANRNFFRDLPLTNGASQLVNVARRFRDQLGWELLFLTAIPSSNDVPWAVWDKCTWAQRHFPDIPVHIGPYAVDKQKHCKIGDILVDDRASNIEEWRAAGGIAIQVEYNGVEDATLELKELFDYYRTTQLSRI
jgi:5'(3')-deoxyribonucleotidase